MPVNDFWEAEDLIPISQTKVSIPSENGLEFSEGQEINIRIPPSVQFLQPKQCYLEWDVQLGLPAGVTGTVADGKRTRLMLDEAIGSQVLIRDITIRSGGAGAQLLEQYQNYNQYVRMKYDYETNDNLKNKRALTEGSLVHQPRNRGTCGTTTSDKNDTYSNPWFAPVLSEAKQSTTFNGATLSGNFVESSDLTTARCIIPLQTGLFQTDKVLPILLTEGLHITIQLENQVNVFRQLDTTMMNNKLRTNPVFYGATNAGATPSGTGMTECYLCTANNLTSLQNFPFVVGEEIMFATDAGISLEPQASDRRGIITDIEMDASAAGTQLVKLTLTDAAGSGNGASFGPAGAVVNPTSGNHWMYSTTCGRQQSTLAGESDNATGAEYVPQYRVRNVNLILQQLEMPPAYVSKMQSMMREGGSMRYDFISSQNFKYSQLSSDIVCNIRLPINFSKMKSLCSVPTDATAYAQGQLITGYGTYAFEAGGEDVYLNSDNTGLVGIWDNLQDYQLFYGGKLNPSRKVSTAKLSSKTSLDQMPLIELEKALAMGGIIPYSFRSFNRNAVIGRAVSLHDGVYDARGKDFNLQLEYTGTAPDKNKLWMNWVTHIKTIVFRGDGIAVEQ